MCYSIYLYHWLLMKIFVATLGGFSHEGYYANLVLVGLPALAVTVLVSAILFVTTEKPWMALSKELSQRRASGQ